MTPIEEDDRAARIAALGRQLAELTARGRPEPGSAGRARHHQRRVHSDGAEPREPVSKDPIELKAKDICLRLLTAAPRPRAGLAAALRRREIPEEVAERVLDRLTEVGLIDDAAYAESFVRTKHRDRGLGRSALRAELRRLGVDPELSGNAVDQVDHEDERRRAADLVAKRLPSAMGAGPVAARRRLMSQLARRGYPAELAAAVIDEAIAGHGDMPGDLGLDGSA